MERLTAAGAVFETDHRGCTTMANHHHATSFATIVLAGAYVEVRDGVPEAYRGGALVLHHAAEEHADRFARDTRCLNLELPPDNGAPWPCGSVALTPGPLRASVDALVRSFYRRERDLLLRVRHLQATLAERPPQPDTRPEWLREVIDRFPWDQAVPLRNAAVLAGVHETHFSRSFRRHVGMTASQYRARARIEHASKRLLATTDSLSRVAMNCGFSDQSHLTRTFSARFGLTPGAFRRIFGS